jgi:uncharacterized membrane protein YidH (DUF202 family)
MLFKIIAFLMAAVPIILFVRAMFFRRPSRVSQRMKDFQKQIDVAVWLFLAVVGCVVAVALIKLIWAWWSPT